MARLGLGGAAGAQQTELVQAALVAVGTRLSVMTPLRQNGELTTLVQRLPRPTAVFCANDLLALGVLQETIRQGLRIPEDLAIVGYDDIEFAAAAAYR